MDEVRPSVSVIAKSPVDEGDNIGCAGVNKRKRQDTQQDILIDEKGTIAFRRTWAGPMNVLISYLTRSELS